MQPWSITSESQNITKLSLVSSRECTEVSSSSCQTTGARRMSIIVFCAGWAATVRLSLTIINSAKNIASRHSSMTIVGKGENTDYSNEFAGLGCCFGFPMSLRLSLVPAAPACPNIDILSDHAESMSLSYCTIFSPVDHSVSKAFCPVNVIVVKRNWSRKALSLSG